jgi:hypothetical protein
MLRWLTRKVSFRASRDQVNFGSEEVGVVPCLKPSHFLQLTTGFPHLSSLLGMRTGVKGEGIVLAMIKCYVATRPKDFEVASFRPEFTADGSRTVLQRGDSLWLELQRHEDEAGKTEF